MDSRFYPVLKLPTDAKVLDFSKGPVKDWHRYSIGRYAEKRVGMYTSPLFGGVRDWHMGIDLGAPVGEEIYAFDDGVILDFADHKEAGNYGPTLITEHVFESRPLFALWGHLSERSLEGKKRGARIRKGEVIAWVGKTEENGGWPPHLHFQLSWKKPVGADLPGAVSDSDLEQSLELYPDPRIVLGSIYS